MIPKTSGIYLILNLINGRYYIGSAIDLKKRWTNHLSGLRRNSHANSFLQRDYNKCGAAAFSFIVIKKVSEDIILLEEQKFLDLFWDNMNKCYNIEKNAGQQLQNHRRKTFTLISPCGEEKTFTGIGYFARKHNISSSSISALLRGKILSCAGWRLQNTPIENIGRTRPKTFMLTLVSPNGIKHSNITNLEQFCKNNNLGASNIRHMIAGKVKSHKGWIIEGRSKKRKNAKSLTIDGIVYPTVLSASKATGIPVTSFWSAISTGRTKVKNISFIVNEN